MYLYRQAGRNVWQVRWWANGIKRQTSTGTANRAEAERVLLAMRQAARKEADAVTVERLLRSVFPERRQQLVSLAAAGQRYKAEAGDSMRTRLVLAYWNRFATWAEAHRPGLDSLAAVDAAACKAFAASLTVAPGTARNLVGSCALVWRSVAPGAGISGDPWTSVRIHGKSKARRPLTPAEIAALLAVTEGTEYGGAILIGAYTGLRYHDIATLRWESVHATELRIEPHKTIRAGIAVVMPLHKRLRQYFAGLARTSGYVFPGLAAQWGTRQSGRTFAAVCVRAGLDHRGITFHSLRHYFVSELARLGTPEDVRRRLVGHSNAATHDRYTHDADAQRAAVDRLE